MRNFNDREQHNREDDMMIFGIRPVMEAIDAGKEVERIFIQRDLSNTLGRELKSLLLQHNIQYSAVPIDKLNRLTRKNHQGVVCFLSAVSYQKIENVVPGLFEQNKFPLVLLLDRITDVRNFGAICRSAECMGVDAVIVPEKGGAMVNGDAIKASAGALNRITVCKEFNLKKTIEYLQESGFAIAGCTEKAEENVFKENLDRPLCIIMGSEEDGISPEYLKRCDMLLKIPLSGKTLSLNVSVAAGIILYEVNRQRSLK
ncbi:MAG TPA: 23S rRNA (guanosine(2251)-2'-O)-methyltransferase RlmB [Bacteroidia bacterium]|nr:23S rRNA (guanosine(2251)-2'-O)-methyltransferase RlmB [Bacteroidia bacterium]